MSMIRFQMLWSPAHRDYVMNKAEHFGITPVEYLRRLIDLDRERDVKENINVRQSPNA